MSWTQRSWLGLILGTVLFVGWGCEGGGTTGPVKATISGKVTFGGEAVSEGVVSFEAPTSGHASECELSGSGTYSATIPVGSYRVAIRPLMVEVEAQADPDTEPSSTKEYKDAPNIPERYRSFESSGLTAQVEEGGSTVDFDMTAE